MKSTLKSLIAVLVVCAMVFTFSACTKTDTPTTTAAASEANGETTTGETPVAVEMTNDGNWVFASGGTSGTYYPLAGAIANNANTKIGTNITVQSTGASKENVMLISQDEADLAILQNDVLEYANTGTGIFEGSGKVEGFSTVASIYSEVCQIVVAADSGIETVSDLAGKKVSIGDAGSGVEQNARQILAAYGLSEDDIQAQRLSFKDSGNSFKDGAIDAFFVTAGVPNTAITELAVTRELKLLNIVGEPAEKLMEDYPFYTPVTISKDQYDTEKDIETLGVRALVICRDDMTEDEIYEFTKSIYENLDVLGESHAKAKEFSLEKATSGVTVDLHPGAAKYYKEKGIE